MGIVAETLRSIGSAFKAGPDRVGATIPFWQSGSAQFTDYQYETLVREGYQKNEIVFACIEEWCTDIAEAELRAYRKSQDRVEVIENHPVVDLVTHPNPWLSGDDLLGGIELHLKIAGNSYLHKVRSGARKVVELWPLRPDRVQVIPSATDYIGGYRYTVPGTVIEIPAADVIHLRTRHPLNDFYGMPPLMAAAGRVDIDNYMRDTVKAFLQNAGIPSGVLTLSQNLDKQEKELLRERFKTEFGGRNAGNIIIAQNGANADWSPMAMPLGARGLVIPELDEIDESRLGMVFRVPLSLVGSRLGAGSSSYANRVSDREMFTEQQLVPEWKRIASALTMGLAGEFPGADFFDFDLSTVRALKEEAALADRARANFLAGIASWQETRGILGLPADADPAALFYVPTTVTPTPVITLMMAPEPVPATQLPPGKTWMLIDTKKIEPRKLHAIRDSAARAMTPVIEDYFAQQAKIVAANLRRMSGSKSRKAPSVGSIFPDGQDELLSVKLNGHYIAIDRATWEYVTDELNLSVPYDEAGPVAQRILNRAGERITGINDVTRGAIRDVLATADEAGYSLYQTVNGVADDGFPGLKAVVDETYQGRAAAIARTEAAFASQDAAIARYRDAGVTEQDIIDGDQDEECDERNGTRVSIDEDVEPLHPNCSVVSIPVVGE